MKITEIVITALENEINLYIIISIFILATLDLIFKKDLKSQIVSLGVLGTFIGIFMGLQNFNPEDMKNSINGILLGLKTAFFTSIVGMGVALILAIIQKLFYKKMDNSSSQENLLLEISNKLNNLEKLDSSKDTDKVIGELERLRAIQTDTRDGTIKTFSSIEELKINSNQENQKLIEILDTNFIKMNNSLEIAIDKLSKGATEEIIKALEQVIQEFNQELQNSFGENFVKLNEAVINLLEWQENYKTHIEHLEEHLNLSTSSIEKSKESLEIISSKNDDVLKVYQELKHIIDVYDRQINELTQHLETYSNLSSSAENMFLTMTNNISKTKEDFTELSKIILSSNQIQKESFLTNTEDIKQSYIHLTQHIKEENDKQIKHTKEMLKDTFEETRENFNKNIAELNLISTHFKNLGEQVPKALGVSLNELNRGLTSLTLQFKKDYEELLNKHKKGYIENFR